MQTLRECPSCQSSDLLASPLSTNVTPQDVARFGEGVVADSDFGVCRRCDLLFARRRQDASDADAYYQAFQVLENRDYAVFPPPQFFLEKQLVFSNWLLGGLAETGVLDRPGRVLNVRCESGVHLAALKSHGFQELYGLDHFESNVRHARENLGLDHVAILHPARIELPFDQKQFDLILANHQITHALEPLQLLQKLRSWLSPGGVLVLYNENDHLRLLRRKRIYKEGVGNYHKQLLTPHSLHNLCRRAGLQWIHFAHRHAAIKWAAPRDCMLVVARRSDPIAADQLPRQIGSPTLRAMLLGRSVYRMYTMGKRVEDIFGRRAA